MTRGVGRSQVCTLRTQYLGKGSGSLSLKGGCTSDTRLPLLLSLAGKGGCTWDGQETRSGSLAEGGVHTRWERDAGGCTQGEQETQGGVVSHWWGGVHGVGKRQEEW